MKNAKPIILLGLIITMISLNAQSDGGSNLKVLLVGSPHWNNYNQEGADVVQTGEIDILSEKYQKELEIITDKIKLFRPNKIFVERQPKNQTRLDSLYLMYSEGKYGLDTRGEVVQMAFRAAKKVGLGRVHGIDYREVEFQFDSVMGAMFKAKQDKLIAKVQQDVMEFQKEYNDLIASRPSLNKIFTFLNSGEFRKKNLGFYVTQLNRAGGKDNFAGSYLVSEWYRRNLYILSLIQKSIEPSDDRIMILLGAGHAAILADFIKYQRDWEIVELNTLLEANN